MYAKDDALSASAVTALGQIGDAQDLRTFIQDIKRKPKAQIDIGAFGGPAIDAIMTEVDNPGTTEAERTALIGHLLSPASHETAEKYLPLLHHRNKFVAEVSARALGRALGPQDEQLIAKLIQDSDRNVRFQALSAVGGKAWKQEYIPTILALLKNDPDDGVKAEAANILGEHKVTGAEPDLRAAYKEGPELGTGFS